ncbi:MAG: magnesium transporter [Acidimicrobiales bacterium]|nr:magnesium transporter [Acidimicrobiales bacterium]
MAGELVYAFRVVRLPLLDAEGSALGRIVDIVIGPAHGGEPPRVIGFVASSQRRRIFVNAGRVAELDNDGARLRSGTIDLRHFRKRQGELLVVADLLDRRLGNETVNDLAVRLQPGRTSAWEVATVALGTRGPFGRRRTTRIVEWHELAELFDAGPDAAEVARLSTMHPVEVAAVIRGLPLNRRRRLAELMEDDRLADLLEELPESEQVRILEGLDADRIVNVLEEMEAEDAADLLAELPGEERLRLLDSMDPDDAQHVRRLLSYGEHTAGGLMTPEPVILTPTTLVAEALARVRDQELPGSEAAQVFVCQPPTVTPTGPFLGTVGIQRLLREPPAMEVGRCIDEDVPFITPDVPELEVAERLAAYNLLAIAVCDDERRLVGAVTIDDVLDRVLPVGWRQRRRVR